MSTKRLTEGTRVRYNARSGASYFPYRDLHHKEGVVVGTSPERTHAPIEVEFDGRTTIFPCHPDELTEVGDGQ